GLADQGPVAVAVGAQLKGVIAAALLHIGTVEEALLGHAGGQVQAAGLLDVQGVALAGLLGVDPAVVGAVLARRGMLQAADLLHVVASGVLVRLVGQRGAFNAAVESVGLVAAGVALVGLHALQAAQLVDLDEAAVAAGLDGRSVMERTPLLDLGGVVA